MAPASSSSSALVTEAVSGSHRLKISGYSLMRGIAPGKFFESVAFTIGGVDWAIQYYPGGKSQDVADYISLFVVLACEKDVNAQFKIALLNHRERPSSTTPTDCKQRRFLGRSKGWGFIRFMRRADLETSQYLRDDCFVVQATLNIIREPRWEVLKARSVSSPPAAPPSDLHQHLVQLLESGEGTDVMFEVGGETFAAHRWLLAARSPVFKAELLGSMKEKSMQCIKIEDMESAVFKALLHFIYSDSVPDTTEELSKESPALMSQHLFVAADRYGLERLRLICIDKLCEQVDVSTVATTLALAEQHHCNQLKDACLEFIATPEVLIAVMLTDGFEHLKNSCPSILNDLLEKFGCPRQSLSAIHGP